jgi:hypothetical protein
LSLANLVQFHGGIFGVTGEEGFFSNLTGLFQQEKPCWRID